MHVSEEARAELWRRGELSWLLRSEQVQLKDGLDQPDVQLVVFNVCRRLGKTFTAVVYACEQSIKCPQKIRYGCAFRTDLEEFVLPAFEIILSTCPDELRPVYIATKQVWRFPNGAVIKLVGLDKNPNGMRGNAIGIMIFDEAGFVVSLRRIYVNVVIPATAKQRGIKIIFLSTPPETPDHYFVELIQKAQTQRNGFYAELTIDAISDLDPAERQRLLAEVGGETSVTAQREFFCKILIDPSIALAPEFDETLHVAKLKQPEYCRFWVSGDTGGVRDRTVLHLMTYDFIRGKVLVLAERAFPRETATAIWVPACKEMEDRRKVSRHVDCHGQTQIDLMGTYNYPCAVPRKDELEATVNQVRTALQRGLVEIDESCQLLILTLKVGTLNRQRTDLARTEALGHMDAFMSLAYGLRHANKENPFPPHGGAKPHTHYMEPVKPVSQTGRALRSLYKGPK